MIAVDTNLLLYAHREDSEFHRKALAVLTGLAEHGAPWAIPWPCIHEFMAISTHPRIYTPPTSVGIALSTMAVWINTPTCRLLAEGPGYFDVLCKLIHSSKSAGPMVHDARIAALCIHHGVQELWTADRDFARFSGLRTRNPLID